MNDVDIYTHVHDPARLAALRAVALLDTPTEEAFDRLTRLAARATNAPVALVSLVDAERQFFKSCLGLPEPWLSRRETPLSHSFCQHNRVPMKPLLVPDARIHPLFRSNPAIHDLKVVAYLGIPLVTTDGYVLGSFCVIDSKPRQWTTEDVAVVKDLAFAVMTEIHLRTEVAARVQAEERLKKQNEQLREAYRNLERETAQRLLALEELHRREQMLVQQNRLASMGELVTNIAHHWRQPLNMLGLIAQELPMMFRAGRFSADYLDASVSRIMESLRRMSRTIDQFGGMTSVQDKKDFSVVDAVNGTVSLFNESLEELKIETVIKAVCSPIIRGFQKEYAQVLLHILNNARDAFLSRKIADAKITIEIGCEAGRSKVTISDNAGGIPDELLDKIFDPYITTKGPSPGQESGMGLYISKMIIEKNMAGSLSVTPLPDGTRFTIAV